MQYQIENLFQQIVAWHEAPASVTPDLALRTAASLPPTEVTWTLLSLIRYRLRQAWARKVSRNRLQSQLALLTDRADFQDESSGASSGIVPGMPEWSYRLALDRSRLVNRTTGEQIDICDSPGVIRFHRFRAYFTSLRQPGPAERRLKELFPDGRGLAVAVDYLITRGPFRLLLTPEDGAWIFELSGALCAYNKPVQAFLAAWDEPGRRLELGSLIGDWQAVHDAARSVGQSDLADSAQILAAHSRRRWLNLARVAADNGTDDALYALANAKAEDLPEYLEAALICRDRVDGC